MVLHFEYNSRLLDALKRIGKSVYHCGDEMIAEMEEDELFWIAREAGLPRPVILEKSDTTLQHAVDRMIYKQTIALDDGPIFRAIQYLKYRYLGRGW